MRKAVTIAKIVAAAAAGAPEQVRVVRPVGGHKAAGRADQRVARKAVQPAPLAVAAACSDGGARQAACLIS